MARPAKPLAKKYGKLSVLSERIEYGRRIVTVRCSCNTKKDVYADALRSGRARSCGAAGCRVNASQVKFDRHYQPRGPQVIDERTLKRHYPRLSGDKKVSIAELAEELEINYNTFYSIIRNVRKAGGVAQYFQKVNAE